MQAKIDVHFGAGKQVDARIGDFIVKTDQPVKNGGSASAPEPFALFLTSIATCAGIYAQEFCSVRKIPTQDMALTLQGAGADLGGGSPAPILSRSAGILLQTASGLSALYALEFTGGNVFMSGALVFLFASGTFWAGALFRRCLRQCGAKSRG